MKGSITRVRKNNAHPTTITLAAIIIAEMMFSPYLPFAISISITEAEAIASAFNASKLVSSPRASAPNRKKTTLVTINLIAVDTAKLTMLILVFLINKDSLLLASFSFLCFYSRLFAYQYGQCF